jgi:SAM-dependent methyltransferase
VSRVDPHATLEPSAWIRRWSHLVPAGARVLDVACGSGRHVRWFAARAAHVTALDRDRAAVEALGTLAEVVVADIENGPWPLADDARFDAIVCTNYLWRPLLPMLVAAVAPGGVLLYETFAEGNASVGRPSNPDFLLRHGELLEAARSLRIVAYEDGFLDAPPRFVQRLAAARDHATPDPAWRLPLDRGTGPSAG